MNKLKFTIWIFTLANIGVALAGMVLNFISENIFSRIMDGRDAIPTLTNLYFGYRVLIFAVFAAPLPIAALVLTVHRSITPEVALLFGAISVLLIALQTLVAVAAVGTPLIIPISRFHG